jgi:hypothetical protein
MQELGLSLNETLKRKKEGMMSLKSMLMLGIELVRLYCYIIA